MSDLLFPNWRELTQFVRDLSEELLTPQGKIKAEYVSISPALQEAVMQFWAETSELVEHADGTATRYGYGISNMTPRDWFNNDLRERQIWATVIASAHKRYQAAVTESAAKENTLAEELDKLRAEIAKLSEAVTAHKPEPVKEVDETQTVETDEEKKKREEAEAAALAKEEEAEGEG